MTKNALKFTNNDAIKIIVCYESENEFLKVQVIDSGAGKNEIEMSKLSKLFSKVERSEEVDFEGIDIGLVVSKYIVENSGGDISVFSEG